MAPAGFAVVEYVEFETLEEAQAYAEPYRKDSREFYAVIER